MKKLGFYAYDVGPASVLKMLAETTVKAGHETVVFPPQERGLTEKRWKEMVDCHAIAIGLSSFQVQEELALVEHMAQNHVPVVVMEDVPGSSRRPNMRSAYTQLLLHPQMN